MTELLTLALYILFAIGLSWLIYWGAGQIGMSQTLRVIFAGIVFVLLLIFVLSRAGVMPL